MTAVPELTDDEAWSFAAVVLQCADPDIAGTQRLARVVMRLLGETVRLRAFVVEIQGIVDNNDLTSGAVRRRLEFVKP